MEIHEDRITKTQELDKLKESIRRDMRQMRRAMSPAWIVDASQKIQDRVLQLPEYREAKTVGCYFALPYEVQTGKLLRDCEQTGKRVCAPAFNEGLKRYELTWVENLSDTKVGRWNIAEPASSTRAGMMDVDCIIVPALAYDHTGGRLGHGGGHYDRILGSWSGVKIGVAFDFQCFDSVPMGSQDIPVDKVVTEKRVYPERSP